MVSLKVWVIAGDHHGVAVPHLPVLGLRRSRLHDERESATSSPSSSPCSALFLGGIVFAYLLVLPRGLDFLLNFNNEYFNVQNRASDYFTFVAFFLLAFGLTFELPVVLVLLAKVGVIDDRFLRKNRRYAILIEALLAAFLTPSQDAFSMLALFVPLAFLYEVSIVLARIVQPKGERRERAEQVKKPSDDDVSQATV